ncbi:MAG: hypothetical protein AB7P04_10170 [Bacteriovoracia bacterium]
MGLPKPLEPNLEQVPDPVDDVLENMTDWIKFKRDVLFLPSHHDFSAEVTYDEATKRYYSRVIVAIGDGHVWRGHGEGATEAQATQEALFSARCIYRNS